MATKPGEGFSLLVTVVLSAAGLATSWAGFQASLWNGSQAVHGSRATSMRTNSTRASTAGGQQRIVDVQLFTGWLAAYATHDLPLADFYEQRFRPEFKPAFRAWVASRPLHSTTAAPTPFELPEYHLARDVEAQHFSRAADEETAASQHANNVSDGYVFDAIILAMVLFFGSTSQRIERERLRVILLGIAIALCVAGVYRLITSPLAWPS
jgi:hypothetical protein